LALSPDEQFLYVAEAGINAIGVVRLSRFGGEVVGLIPTGWWPSGVQVGATAIHFTSPAPMAAAQGRTTMFHPIIWVHRGQAHRYSKYHSCTFLFSAFNSHAPRAAKQWLHPWKLTRRIRTNSNRFGVASNQIKHVVFINKENATHDIILGDITQTRKGVAVNGNPDYSLGYAATPNHHELAFTFAFSDNFYLDLLCHPMVIAG